MGNFKNLVFDLSLAIRRRPATCSFLRTQKLQEFIDLLVSDPTFQMKSPGVTTSIDGKNKTLYMSKVASIEEATR